MAACLADPADMGLRLVLADYCLEHGRERASAALRLTQDLTAAAGDPAWDWLPPVETEDVALDYHIPATERHRFFWRDGIARVRRHYPRPWFPLPRRQQPAWAGRIFAVAALRAVGPTLPPAGTFLAICELSAAGLLGSGGRDWALVERLREWRGGLDHRAVFVFDAMVPAEWRALGYARSGGVGRVPHTVHSLTDLAFHKWNGGKATATDPEGWGRQHEFERERCAGGWHLKTLLRMARRLRAFLGCDT